MVIFHSYVSLPEGTSEGIWMARIAVDARSCQVSELRLEHRVWRSAPTAAPVDGSIQSWSITDPSIIIASIYTVNYMCIYIIYIYIYIYTYIYTYIYKQLLYNNISISILSSRLLAWLSDWTTPPDQRPKAHRGEPSAHCQWWNLPAAQCASSLTEFRIAGFPCDTDRHRHSFSGPQLSACRWCRF